MPCFSPEAKELFRHWDELEVLEDLENFYAELLKRRVNEVQFGKPDAVSPMRRARLNCQMIRQSLIHRAERLLVSTGSMLLDRNPYGIALLARGHVEAVAVLGNFCSRLASFAAGRISFDKFEWEAADALMGAKHSLFEKANSPENILTCIERTDKFLNQNILGTKDNIVRDTYDWLSEFAHPNFLSNQTAFKLDKANGRFLFDHASAIRKEDFQLFSYLLLSASFFLPLHDQFAERSEKTLSE
jgi:hypothetical protein